MKKRNTA